VDWQYFVALGVVLTIIVAVLDITHHVFGFWNWWNRGHDRKQPTDLDHAQLRARIRLATGSGNGVPSIDKTGDSGSMTIKFRNEGLHPAYKFRPMLASGKWEAAGHANGIPIPRHDERFFQFPFPYRQFPSDGNQEFVLTATYRDGSGDHVFTMRFHFTGRDYPDWRPVIESEG